MSKDITLHLGQARAMESTARTVICCAGVRAGKSYIGPLFLAREILKDPGGIYLITAPTFPILNTGTIPTLKEQWAGTDFDGVYNEHQRQWIFNNPKLGTVYVLSLHDWTKTMVSFSARAAWSDEAANIDLDAFNAVETRLAQHYGRHLITTTPYQVTGWFRDMVMTPQPDVFVSSWPSWWNSHFNIKSYWAAKARMSTEQFQMFYEGKMGQPENAVYPEFSDENITPAEYNPAYGLFASCDFNVSPMHWVIGQVRGETVFIFDEIYVPFHALTSNTAVELARRVKAIYTLHPSHPHEFNIYGDASGQSSHSSASMSDYAAISKCPELIQLQARLYYPAANPPVADRVGAVNGLIKNAMGTRKLFIHPRCAHLITDIRSSQYIGGTRTVDKKTYDAHGADSLGYVCHYRFRPSIGNSQVGSVNYGSAGSF